MNKEEIAINELIEYEPPEGYFVAFSGGKDSQVCYDLCKKAGVKFDSHYNSTTFDPPLVLQFIKDYYPSVTWHYPTWKGKPTNFYKLVTIRGLPIRQRRWCCEVFKEQSGYGRLMIDGVRAAESNKRSKRKKFEYFLKPYWNRKNKESSLCEEKLEYLTNTGKAKKVIHLIFDWSESDIWNYIKKYQLPYCGLYDQGWKRIGCICCPMATASQKKRDIESYPIYRKNILKSIDILLSKGLFPKFNNSIEVLDWWLSDVSVNKFFAIRDQLTLDI